MSDGQFFDGGWCWMSHPDWNIGNAIPVFMFEANGTRFYVPLDPSDAAEYEWDKRSEDWQMVRPPMADLQDAIKRDDLLAALQGVMEIEEDRLSRGVFKPNAEGMRRIEAARAAIAAATGTPT